MSFRNRLVLFLIIVLVGVQGLTAIAGYSVLRDAAIEQGKVELSNASDAFSRQLDVFSRRVTDGVQVLSLDYALREAIARNDSQTESSALRNHGNRIGATRMLLIGLDGVLTADTGRTPEAGAKFPFGDLLDAASVHNQGIALATLDGRIYWIVVVPVLAPLPIAFIAACVPVNDALLEELRGLSSAPRAIALATASADGQWSVVAKSSDFIPLTGRLPAAQPGATASTVVSLNGAEFLTNTTPIASTAGSDAIMAVFTYPLTEVLNAYRPLTTTMLLVLAATLLVALLVAVLIAHGVSRPLESLAGTARQIAKGDYTPPPKLGKSDEIGQLSDALINMTQSISEREAALTRAIDAMEVARNDAIRANEAKSQFLSNVSHELRTPLNAIIGFGEMLDRQVLGPLGTPRYGEYAKGIYESGLRLLKLIEEMLELSAAATGRIEIEHRSVDFGAVLNECFLSLRHVAKRSAVSLVLISDLRTWPPILGDDQKLKQALFNLIHNAIKFTPPDGRVSVSAQIAANRLQISVCDTGVGIRAEDLSLILRPFHRLRSALDGREQGAGLGLSFANAVVEAHGGTLTIESTPGKGTTVTIHLPVGQPFQTIHEAA